MCYYAASQLLLWYAARSIMPCCKGMPTNGLRILCACRLHNNAASQLLCAACAIVPLLCVASAIMSRPNYAIMPRAQWCREPIMLSCRAQQCREPNVCRVINNVVSQLYHHVTHAASQMYYYIACLIVICVACAIISRSNSYVRADCTIMPRANSYVPRAQ